MCDDVLACALLAVVVFASHSSPRCPPPSPLSLQSNDFRSDLQRNRGTNTQRLHGAQHDDHATTRICAARADRSAVCAVRTCVQDRSSSRVLAPPGGGSSFNLFGGGNDGQNSTAHNTTQSAARRFGPGLTSMHARGAEAQQHTRTTVEHDTIGQEQSNRRPSGAALHDPRAMLSVRLVTPSSLPSPTALCVSCVLFQLPRTPSPDARSDSRRRRDMDSSSSSPSSNNSSSPSSSSR